MSGLHGDAQAAAEVVPEFNAMFCAGLEEAEKAVAAIATGSRCGFRR